MARLVAYADNAEEEAMLREQLANLHAQGVETTVINLHSTGPSNPKRIDIAEFRRMGLLQEANRRFFHPIGLALEAIQFEDETEALGGIWDAREDPEGYMFDTDNMTLDADAAFMYDSMIDERAEARVTLLGAVVQPIPGMFDDAGGLIDELAEED
jgi:hypothetical protein